MTYLSFDLTDIFTPHRRGVDAAREQERVAFGYYRFARKACRYSSAASGPGTRRASAKSRRNARS